MRLSWDYFHDFTLHEDEFASAMDHDHDHFLKILVYDGKSFIPEFILRPRTSGFLTTHWEASFSRIGRTSDKRLASWFDGGEFLSPVVEDGYSSRFDQRRVVAHFGWVYGAEIFLPRDKIGVHSPYKALYEQRRLLEARAQAISDCLRPTPSSHLSACSGASRGQIVVKDQSDEDRHLNNINAFLEQGGRAWVLDKHMTQETVYKDFDDSFLTPDWRCYVLVSPEGQLLRVLKVEHHAFHLQKVDTFALLVAIAGLWIEGLVIEFIAVNLFRLGVLAARGARIRGLKLSRIKVLTEEELSMAWGGGTARPLTDNQVDRAIELLRNGHDVHVESIGQMRQIQGELGQLGVRSESSSTIIPQRPAVSTVGKKEVKELPGSFRDGRGTYRVDPPHADPPDAPGTRPYHAHNEYPHINITLPDGKTLSIVVTGSRSF
jgi:hypothetical protein